jgi:hypothetical protein
VLHRPVEITRVTGHLVLRLFNIEQTERNEGGRLRPLRRDLLENELALEASERSAGLLFFGLRESQISTDAGLKFIHLASLGLTTRFAQPTLPIFDPGSNKPKSESWTAAMAHNIEGLRKTLKSESLEFLRKHHSLDENRRRDSIWRFAEKMPQASPMAKAHFVNEVHTDWERLQSPPPPK